LGRSHSSKTAHKRQRAAVQANPESKVLEIPGCAFLKLPHPSLPWPLCLLAIVAQLVPRDTEVAGGRASWPSTGSRSDAVFLALRPLRQFLSLCPHVSHLGGSQCGIEDCHPIARRIRKNPSRSFRGQRRTSCQ